ncbi:uncharacterized protein LOC141632786 [Silene latifolia]|uniref:uncharacterized protein LOC141632786 n=1 Tax=Silene latifolia TaxID=37657 RepID=UPI003D77569A
MISCCNVIYKAISKVLCNGLGEVIPEVISQNQSAFIRGRDIVENILICQDLTKLYNRSSCSPRVIMKLDLQKAYESLEWSFLEEMMQALNFPNRFTKMIMECGLLQEIADLAGLKVGSLPFKYLGIPIAPRKLSVLECNILVEKVVDRIRALGARKLSYAVRLVLIKSILSTLHLYWARIFILSSSMLKKIEGICRNFFWQGDIHAKAPSLVSWESACYPKKQGGLGITDITLWNRATMGKYVWWIMQKKDHLWVKWVHSIYIKQTDWQTYEPNTGASWSLRSICRCKNQMLSGYTGTWWLDEDGIYTVAKGYKWLRGDNPDVSWHSGIWNSVNLPKHYFIGWLAMRQRLLTKDRLCSMFGSIEEGCDLCGTDKETHSHLFFQCPYSNRCLHLLSWYKIQLPTTNIEDWWSTKKFQSQIEGDILAAIMVAAFYNIWWMRNHCRLNNALFRPEYVVGRIKNVIKNRCNSRWRDFISLHWLQL